MLRVVVCVSGGGTNLQAVIDGVEKGSVTNVELVRDQQQQKCLCAGTCQECRNRSSMRITPRLYRQGTI